jgi:hypothetical protein
MLAPENGSTPYPNKPLPIMSSSITVAVGSPDDLRSSIWRLWVQGDEVYFGERYSVGRVLKVSFHKTGKWHIAWHKDVKEDEEDRFVCKWKRPEPFLGLVSGILVLVDPFRPREPFKNKALLEQAIKWLPCAPYGDALLLKIMIATEYADLDAVPWWPTEKVLARLSKANGDRRYLFLRVSL